MKYYEFVTGDTIEIAPGRTLKRIRAVAEIAALGVAAGQLGGYIEHEKNLFGDAWVYGNARVYDSARVSGNALVFGNARVYGNAWVYGSARVYGNAQVYGNALVYGSAQVYDSAQVDGDAQVYDNAQVYGSARVYGNAWVYGSAQVSGNAWVYGDALVSGDAMIDENGLIFWASKVGSENGTLTVYNTKSNELEVTRGCFCGSVDDFLAASEAKHDDDTHLEYRLLIEVATSRITRARERLGEA